MSDTTTVTLSHGHAFEVGDRVSITVPDRRWWMRLWHFVRFREPPTVVAYHIIQNVIDSNVIAIGRASRDAGEQQ